MEVGWSDAGPTLTDGLGEVKGRSVYRGCIRMAPSRRMVSPLSMISVLAHWLLETIAWWTILAGNLIASVVMLGCFLRGHRVAWREFLHAPL